MYSKNFIKQEQAVEKIFDEYMSKEGYSIEIYDEDDWNYLGYGGYAIKEDKFAVIFNLRGQVYPRDFSISVDDRNGNFVITGETVAIYSISANPETTTEELTSKFKIMLNDIYDKYKIYSKENRLDFVYNEYEVERRNYDDIDLILHEKLDNFCENCSDKEWQELIEHYCIKDNESYVGETMDQLEEMIIMDYKSSSNEQKQKIIDKLNKYINKEKIYEKQEIEFER